jgi:16S rRNA (guanine1207-N2)-methyltransferase
VVTNPPFHVGKATDLNVPLQFIQESWEVLATGGRLFLVANRTLPYERVIRHRFGNIATLHDGPRFKVLAAVRQS